MAGPKLSRDFPTPAEVNKLEADRNAALPKVEDGEAKPEVSVQDRGDAIIAQASTQLNSFLSSMQTRMSGYAARARKALGFGVGAVASGAESATTHASNLAGGMRDGLVGAAKGAAEIPGFVYDDVVKPVREALHDLVRPEEDLSPAERSALADIDIKTIEAQKMLNAVDPSEPWNRELHAQELEDLQAEKEKILSAPRARSLRGSATAAAAARAAGKGAGMVAGGAAAGAMMAGAGLASAGRWGANKAGEAVVGIAEAAVDPVIKASAEKKAEWLAIDPNEVLSKLLSKITGKEQPVSGIKLTDKQLMALGAAIDAAGVVGKVGTVAYEAMLMDHAVEIVQNLGRGGVDLAKWVTDPNVPQQVWDDMKEFNVKTGKALGDAAGVVADALLVKPAQAVGRGAAAVGMGALGLGAAGVGLAVEGGKFAANAGAEGLNALGNAGVKLDRDIRDRASAAVNTPEMLALRKNVSEAPDAMHREIKKVDQELVALTAKGASFFERMRNKVNDLMNDVNTAINKFLGKKITEDMKASNPDLTGGIAKATEMLPQIDAAAMEMNRILTEAPEDAPTPRIAPVKRPAPKL